MFRIKDDGVGMSEDFVNKIFEPFSREETGENGFIQGTGLGMSIAKEIVDLMHGYISVDSQPGKGTHITVSLEIEPAEEEKLFGDDSQNPENKMLSGMRFLIAEDNEINGEIITEMLAVKGAESVVVNNGREAVECFEKSAPGRFDAVLMDIRMPVMDGYEAARAIRRSKNQEGKEIIIIAMTADAFEDDVRRTFEAGMDAHTAKPVDMDAFVNTVISIKNMRRERTR